MTRVTFGITSSPFLLCLALQVLINKNLQTLFEPCSFYVDDVVASVAEIEEARNIYSDSSFILSQASMILRKWNSNRFEKSNMFDATTPDEQKIWVLLGTLLPIDHHLT